MKPQGMGGWPDQIVERVARLPRRQLEELAKGPLPEPSACRVCDVLRWPGYASGAYGPGWEERQDANWLLNWHGIDPVRCGSIYTAALLASQPHPVLSQEQRERLKRIADRIDGTIEDADWPESAQDTEPLRDPAFLRDLATGGQR